MTAFAPAMVAQPRKTITIATGGGDVDFPETQGKLARAIWPKAAGNVAVWFDEDDLGGAATVFPVIAGQLLPGFIRRLDASLTTVEIVVGF